jgi:uracil-DNA glycosylase
MNRSQREKLELWLGYFDDLGLEDYYRDRAPSPRPHAARTAPARAGRAAPAPPVRSAVPPSPFRTAPPAAPPIVKIPIIESRSLFETAEQVENDSLERIREDIGECTRCRLCRSRNHIVFGDGSPRAELVFIGEGPGQEEDIQGLPFVGRAGKLLDRLIAEMGLERREVYIGNVVKCRPPENRTPEKDEIATCSPFLFRQLAVIHPRVIVCLGAVAAETLLGASRPLAHLRGQWFDWRGFRLLVTYHTAYVLRNPNAIAQVRADLKKVTAFLGPPGKKGPGAGGRFAP